MNRMTQTFPSSPNCSNVSPNSRARLVVTLVKWTSNSGKMWLGVANYLQDGTIQMDKDLHHSGLDLVIMIFVLALVHIKGQQ